MAQWQERAELLFKEEGINKLKNANILVVGLGGVGSFAAEFLVRAGIGKMTIVDGDTVDITNINRQLPALHSTIGKTKVDIVASRLLDINPELDCIDSVTPKLNLIISAKRKKVKVISCMGAGGKYDSSKVFVRDISNTKDCPLAKNIRKRLKAVKIDKGVKAVFSVEIPEPSSLKMTDGKNYKRSFYGTNSWMPAQFGLQAAETVVRYLLEK